MSLVKFRKRRPFGNLVTSDFFWTGRKGEPALNIKENDANFEIELAAPGFAKKDFKITIEDGFLNISAEKSTSEEEKEDNYTRREFSYNSFERSLQLPENIKDEEVKAKYNDGILSFKLNKKEVEKKQKAKIVEIA